MAHARKKKSSYTPSDEHLYTAYVGAKKGLSQADIAKSIGISLSTFKRNLALFEPSLKKGHDESDDVNCERVESALMKLCLGYEYEEVQIEKWIDDNGKERVKQRKTKRHNAPVAVAQFFWLCNRFPDKWKQQRKEDAGNSDPDNINRVSDIFSKATSAMRASSDEQSSNQ